MRLLVVGVEINAMTHKFLRHPTGKWYAGDYAYSDVDTDGSKKRCHVLDERLMIAPVAQTKRRMVRQQTHLLIIQVDVCHITQSPLSHRT